MIKNRDGTESIGFAEIGELHRLRADRQRATDYIAESGIGGGDDPIGFLIALHRSVSFEVTNLKLANKEARKTIDRLNAMIPREANDGGSAPGE